MSSVRALAEATHAAYQHFLNSGTTKTKNAILATIAEKIRANQSFLMEENKKDLANGEKDGLGKAFLDRLALTEKRIQGMADSCLEIAALPDPVGRITDMVVRPQGFKVGRMRAPIGVIGIIYEARPNVTIEAATLCMKSGNAVILRGGSSAYHSNIALVKILQDSLEAHGIEKNLISYMESTDRNAIDELLVLDDLVHLIIPRGGEGLIRSVVEKSRIPVLKHYKGVCNMFVDRDADLDMAVKLAINAKVQRPAVCNSLENLVVDEAIAEEFLPEVLNALQAEGVEIRGCEKTRAIYSTNVKPATEQDFYEEFLDLILAVKVVKNVQEGIAFINKYSSSHTETIITKNIQTANLFVNNVDSASVMINASTRLSDGGVYGLGAEIGISTDKLHARGPMGLEELTTYKWVLYGEGHVRE